MIKGIDEISNSDFAIEIQASNQYLALAATMMKPKGMAFGCHKFTLENLRHLIENLDKLRMMVCQPDSGQRGNGVNWHELEFVKSHICVEVMQAYLSGCLAQMPVDN